MSRDYPDEPADEFPRPPRTVTDREGRDVELLSADATDRESVLEMYLSFDPADRAQGIPPAREAAIDDWLDTILGDETYNVVAVNEHSVVGHATLVPDRHGEHELAIFVLQAFQGAGIGTELVETLLGLAQSAGLEKVWLTVERWNDAAVALYKKVGFETTSAESFEIEMSIRL